jgi:SPP1 family predicted phage head-tail adaptor
LCPEDFQDYALIEYVGEVSDGAGGYVDSWTTRVGIWCAVETTSGGESIVAGRIEHNEALEFTTHYDATILPTDRIIFEGVNYKITRIENIDRRNEYMRIYAETGRT